jgi:hypothetical protein
MEEKYKDTMEVMQQRKMGRRDGICLVIVRDEMAPADQATNNSPRPVALKVEVDSLSGRFLGPGSPRWRSYLKLHTLRSPPCPTSLCNLENRQEQDG